MYGSERKRQQATLLSHGAGVVLRRAPAAKRETQALETPSLDQLEANAALLKRQAEIEQELQLARDLQQGLLLEAVPYLPGWELSAISLPARDLGGDLYDFLRLEHGQHGIMIGDVSGKGLSAALRMAVARTVFRHEARRGSSPACTLADVNEGVLSEIPYGMVTMLYAQLDPAQGSLELANAGHNYPLLVNGHVEELEISGLPLGVDNDSDYNQLRVVLAPADMLVFYTDGVVEATNSEGEMFGYERLEQLVSDFKQLRPRALVAKLLAQVRAWTDGTAQDDDITLVVIRRRLTRLHDEIWEVAVDVLGLERAQQLWSELLIEVELTAEQWANLLPEAVAQAKQLFGRGLARELQQQFRLVIDEYKDQIT